MTLAEAVTLIKKPFGEAILSEGAFRGEQRSPSRWNLCVTSVSFAAAELGFDYLLDISSVDHFGDYPRFELVYELYSMAGGIHLRAEDTCSR